MFRGYKFLGATGGRHGSPACGVHYWLIAGFVTLTLLAVFYRIGPRESWIRASSQSYATDEFVAVKGKQLQLHCRPFYIAGFNTHDLVQNAMLTGTDFSTSDGLSGDQMVNNLMHAAQNAKLNVIRTWAHTNHDSFPFQKTPGNYEASGWAALDLVVESARRRGLRLILSLVDNWKYYNGVDQYIDWSKSAPERTQDRPADTNGDPTPLMYADERIKAYEVERHSLFYDDLDAKAFYKQHVAAVLNRKNSYSGRRYKDDPTILGWDLLNEPRCESWLVEGCDAKLHAWIQEMAAYVKSLTPNQLVLIGSEGFYNEPNLNAYNPQDWAQSWGQHFTKNSQIQDVDLSAIHVWPNNWERTSDQFLTEWLDSHVNVSASVLQKPMLLEEFGKKLLSHEQTPMKMAKLRDHVYRLTYRKVEEHVAQGSALVGSLFWRWNLPLWRSQDRGDYGVDPSDSTFEVVKSHARFMHKRMVSRPPEASCGYECWTPGTWFGLRTCRNTPELCSAYWAADAAGNNLPTGPFFVSKTECCRSGIGAYPRGCAV